MAENINKNGEELEEATEECDVITLTDLETGKEEEFILLDEANLDGNEYMALEPVENPNEEFVILKKIVNENGDIDLVNIEDDAEFDKVVDYFEDHLFGEIDYDTDN